MLLLGESGGGKTSLINLLLSLQEMYKLENPIEDVTEETFVYRHKRSAEREGADQSES